MGLGMGHFCMGGVFSHSEPRGWIGNVRYEGMNQRGSIKGKEGFVADKVWDSLLLIRDAAVGKCKRRKGRGRV